MCNEYNGYTNYPTWAVSLWIDNDSGMYDFVQEQAVEFYNDATTTEYNTQKQVAIYDLSEWLKDFFSDEENPLIESASMYSDLLGWALDSVDWYEIAENWIDNVIENELVDTEE